MSIGCICIEWESHAMWANLAILHYLHVVSQHPDASGDFTPGGMPLNIRHEAVLNDTLLLNLQS